MALPIKKPRQTCQISTDVTSKSRHGKKKLDTGWIIPMGRISSPISNNQPGFLFNAQVAPPHGLPTCRDKDNCSSKLDIWMALAAVPPDHSMAPCLECQTSSELKFKKKRSVRLAPKRNNQRVWRMNWVGCIGWF